ncbi:hypothetical protein GCM10028815_24150 [Mariniluteicoccus flavus]
MWAALTELHSMLWLYENLAFRDGLLPHRLTPEERERFFAESAAYCELVGGPEDEIQRSKADLGALYEKYADLFGTSPTMSVWPDSSEGFEKAIAGQIKKNFHVSQLPAAIYGFALDHGLFRQIAIGASSGKLRRSLGMGPVRSAVAVGVTKAALPLVWVLQQAPFEQHYMRLMWGPDGVRLIENARKLQGERGRVD